MDLFDQLFFDIFKYYKNKYKTKANDIALLYILLLQASALLLIGIFFLLFFNEMSVTLISTGKAWVLFVFAVFLLIFRNWIYYTGKKRKVLNTKNKSAKPNNIWFLWLIPLVCLILSVLLMQRL